MFSQKSIFQSDSSPLDLTRLILPKGSLAALSKDADILAWAGAGDNAVQYLHRPTQTRKTINAASVSAICFRPNDKQYQKYAPASEIKRDEILIACPSDNQIKRCIPSLGGCIKAMPVQEPTAMACNGTGQLLAVGTALGELLVFDLSSRDLNLVFSSVLCSAPIDHVAFGMEGEYLFAHAQNQVVYMERLNIEYFEECGTYLQPGGSVFPLSRITNPRGRGKRINGITSVLPAKVGHISVHPTIREVALITLEGRVFFWNYACATISCFDCPLNGALVGYFCADTDHFLISSREGLAVYDLTRRQKRVASSTCAGGPYPVQNEIVLSIQGRPRIFANDQPGLIVRALAERDGNCLAVCS